MNELLKEIVAEYSQFLKTPKVRSLWELVNSGTATFKDAADYSKITADKMSELLIKYIGFESAYENKYTTEELSEIVKSALVETYGTTAGYSAQVQQMLNDSANINIRAIKPKYNADRINNLIDKLLSGEEITGEELITEANQWLIEANVVENVARSAVNDTIKENASLLTDAGFKTVITRHLDPSGCCDWCRSMAGTYIKGTEPSDFWRIHKDCGCWIEYKPAKKASQYVRYTTVNGQRRKITR